MGRFGPSTLTPDESQLRLEFLVLEGAVNDYLEFPYQLSLAEGWGRHPVFRIFDESLIKRVESIIDKFGDVF